MFAELCGWIRSDQRLFNYRIDSGRNDSTYHTRRCRNYTDRNYSANWANNARIKVKITKRWFDRRHRHCHRGCRFRYHRRCRLCLHQASPLQARVRWCGWLASFRLRTRFSPAAYECLYKQHASYRGRRASDKYLNHRRRHIAHLTTRQKEQPQPGCVRRLSARSAEPVRQVSRLAAPRRQPLKPR